MQRTTRQEASIGELVAVIVDFFFQAEDGIRDRVRSRGLGDVYKGQFQCTGHSNTARGNQPSGTCCGGVAVRGRCACLLYTSDAADELRCVDPGGRRIIKKKKTL